MKLVKPSRHHILARCRNGGEYNNVVVLPDRWHMNFHHLFQVLTREEIHVFIDEVLTPGTEWNYKSLSELRKRISGGQST
jgi:hypothetical protein